MKLVWLTGGGIVVDPMELDFMSMTFDVFFIFDTLIRSVVSRCSVIVTVGLVVVNFRIGNDKLKNSSIKEKKLTL